MFFSKKLKALQKGLWRETKSTNFSNFFHSPFSQLALIPLCICVGVKKERLSPLNSGRNTQMNSIRPVVYYMM